MMRSLVTVLLFAFVFASSNLVHAAEVIKVKGKSALINMKGDSAKPGDIFYTLRPNGKRAGIVRIARIKGNQAIARVIRGSAAAGMSLEYRQASGGGGGKTAAKAGGTRSSSASGRSYWGGLFGYSRDSMSVNVNHAGTGDYLERVSLSGSGFSAKGLFDYELFPQVWFRGTTGLEGFSATGPARCSTNNQQACDANIYYLSFDFIGRYVFSSGGVRPWAGGGLGLLFPMSKKASALEASSISTTNVIVVAGGVDWFLSPTMYVPLSVEYGMLPKSDEVEATWIALRAGIAIPF